MEKNRYIILGITATVLVLGLWAMFASIHPVRNVFDEIYYDEYNSSRGKFEYNAESYLSHIKGIRKSNHEFNIEDGISEPYKDEYYPANVTRMTYSFGFVEPYVNLVYTVPVTENITFVCNDKYTLANKMLTQSFFIINDNQVDDVFIKDISEIESILKEYGMSKADVQRLHDEVIYDIMLTDWFNAKTDSRFSLEDLGDVTIEYSDLLK